MAKNCLELRSLHSSLLDVVKAKPSYLTWLVPMAFMLCYEVNLVSLRVFALLYLPIGVYGRVPDLRSLLAKLQHSLLCTTDMYREEEKQKIEREKLGFKE